MTIGDRIKLRRHEIGMTQVQLAETVGESKQTIYKYETNKVTNIPIDKIQIIAQALHTSPSSLLGYEIIEEPASASADGWESEAIQLLRSLSEDELARELAYLRQRAGDSDK